MMYRTKLNVKWLLRQTGGQSGLQLSSLVISLTKFDSRMRAFKHVMDLTCTGKEEGLKWLSNLILSNGFRILAIKFLAILAIKNLSN